MDNEKDCVFCKIVRGEIPSYKIYEDENSLIFLDIAKDIDGHMVAVPKTHCKNILDCGDERLSQLMKAVKIVCKHCVENCGFDGVNLLNASGESAGQSVGHFHLHIIPRKKEDGENAWPVFKGAKRELFDVHRQLKIEK